MSEANSMSCASCAWWRRGGAALAEAARDPSASQFTGTCHLATPMVVATAFGAKSYWPVTHESCFCSDHVWHVTDAEFDDRGISEESRRPAEVIRFPSPGGAAPIPHLVPCSPSDDEQALPPL